MNTESSLLLLKTEMHAPSTPSWHPADPTETLLKVAGQIRKIRRAHHLSQRQLAARIQVPRTYISKIENGKLIPTLSTLARLAAALEVDLRQLIGEARGRRQKKVAPILADPLQIESEERAEASVIQRAAEVLGDRSDAMRWLGTPVRALDYATPISLLHDAKGREAVLTVIGRLEHGVL
jgi:putative toxin-antitoxin system antitoxin component (TIGR02293 family)